MKDAKGHGSDARGSNLTSAQRTNLRQDKIFETAKRLQAAAKGKLSPADQDYVNKTRAYYGPSGVRQDAGGSSYRGFSPNATDQDILAARDLRAGGNQKSGVPQANLSARGAAARNAEQNEFQRTRITKGPHFLDPRDPRAAPRKPRK